MNTNFYFSGINSKSTIIGSCDHYMFSFRRNCKTVFHSYCPSLHSDQQSVKDHYLCPCQHLVWSVLHLGPSGGCGVASPSGSAPNSPLASDAVVRLWELISNSCILSCSLHNWLAFFFTCPSLVGYVAYKHFPLYLSSLIGSFTERSF